MKVMKKRRRFEGKTNYKKRLKILKGEFPRVVFRKTNRYIVGQLIKSVEAQDKVEIGVTSKDLLKYGWPKDRIGSLKSIPAAYLTGFLIGEKILEKNKEKVIVDFGLTSNIHKSRMYAFLKGLVDSELKINYKEKTFPEKERIKGVQLKEKINIPEILKKISASTKSEKENFADEEIKKNIMKK